MTQIGYVLGFCDFECPRSIEEVGRMLSETIFGGIAFVRKTSDEDYDDGNLVLQRDFLGIQIEVSGEGGRYTLELATVPSASVEGVPVVGDLSAMIKQRVQTLLSTEVCLVT
jgi:hypothetical protein